MPAFKYIARSKTGERLEGTIDAADKRAALLQLERSGHVPVSVAESGTAGTPAPAKASGKKISFLEWRSSRKRRMKLREVLLFTRELSDLLASGMKVGNALHTLSKRETSQAHNEIIATLRDDIMQGASFSDALAKWPGTFSTLYISMVKAGEASGQLAEVLERLCKHFERVQEAREKVMMALIYPAIVLSMGSVTMVFSMIFVVPRFSAIFAELGSTLPLPTLILIKTSRVLVKYGWAIAIGLVALIILIRRALKTERGRRWWHRQQLKIPLVRNIITANAYAHFARTLGTLLANGVQVLQALAIVEDTVGNVVIAGEIRAARSRVTDGATISRPLAEGKVFPPLLTDMLAVGEESGDMSTALVHIANRYDNDLDRSVKIFTSVLEPVMILVMAILVGFVAVSMLLAVFDLTSGLKVK